jgi:hypothetical protein
VSKAVGSETEKTKTNFVGLLYAGFLTGLLINSKRLSRQVPPKRRLTFTGMNGVISHRAEFFTTILVVAPLGRMKMGYAEDG